LSSPSLCKDIKLKGDKGIGYLNKWGNMYQVNNLVTFSGKPIGSEEFLNQMVEILGIIIDRRPKGRSRKRES